MYDLKDLGETFAKKGLLHADKICGFLVNSSCPQHHNDLYFQNCLQERWIHCPKCGCSCPACNSVHAPTFLSRLTREGDSVHDDDSCSKQLFVIRLLYPQYTTINLTPSWDNPFTKPPPFSVSVLHPHPPIRCLMYIYMGDCSIFIYGHNIYKWV